MTKIVSAVNVMISNKNAIGNIKRSHGAFYFIYDKKYKWSIHPVKKSQDYVLFFYPGTVSLDTIMEMDVEDWNTFDEYIMYKTDEIKAPEAKKVFTELFTILKERQFGLDNILNDIIEKNTALREFALNHMQVSAVEKSSSR
jgi:hypothetical protein